MGLQTQGSIMVERKENGNIVEHYDSKDYFTNVDEVDTFCSQRGATCVKTKKTTRRCSRCSCYGNHSTFVSYNQGCKNLTTTSRLFGSTHKF